MVCYGKWRKSEGKLETSGELKQSTSQMKKKTKRVWFQSFGCKYK